MKRHDDYIPNLLSTHDVAKLLKVSRSLVYELVETGKLPSYRIGSGRGAIRISEKDVAAFLRSSRKERDVTSENAKTKPRQSKRLRHLKG